MAPITNTSLDLLIPSISANNCETTLSITPPESPLCPRLGANESNSSKNITQGLHYTVRRQRIRVAYDYRTMTCFVTQSTHRLSSRFSVFSSVYFNSTGHIFRALMDITWIRTKIGTTTSRLQIDQFQKDSVGHHSWSSQLVITVGHHSWSSQLVITVRRRT